MPFWWGMITPEAVPRLKESDVSSSQTVGRAAIAAATVVLAAVAALALSLLAGSAVAEAQTTTCADGPAFSVGTEADLNTAIDCYNMATTAAAFSITFTGPIGPLTASTTTITQSGAGFSLAIDGATNTLTSATGFNGFTVNDPSPSPTSPSSTPRSASMSMLGR